MRHQLALELVDDVARLDELGGRSGGPPLLTPEQAATCLAICRTKLYELLRRGELESVQIGSSRRIPEACVAEYVQRLRSEQVDGETRIRCRPF